MNLYPFFESAVLEMNRRQSESLGDRTQYIGSSDVAGCARKVALQRKTPKTPSVPTLLKFARGHAAEWMLDGIFQSSSTKLHYDRQVELKHPDMPLRAHLDFLFYADFDGNPELHVIEVKSVSGIPDEPYPQWEDQLHYQLGMLRLLYPKGNIGGSVLAVDLNAGQIHQFNGYQYDEAVFNYLYCRALHLLDVLNDIDTPQASPSHLCSYCQYRQDCPAMSLPKVQLPLEIEALAGKYAELNSIKNSAEKELKAIRLELTDFTGPSFKGESGRFSLQVTSVPPSLTVDAGLLRQQYPQIYPTVLKQRAGYSKLEVKPVKQAV